MLIQGQIEETTRLYFVNHVALESSKNLSSLVINDLCLPNTRKVMLTEIHIL